VTDVDALLADMTLEEKCAQLRGTWYSALATDGRPDPSKMSTLLAQGMGHITRLSAEAAVEPAEAAACANEVQRFCVEQTRLGIPAIVHEEAVGGLCARGATQFPQGIGLASTWDPALVEEVATAIGREMRSVGARVALSPVLDIARDARWGRLEETYGEDPELSSRMAVAYVRGLQGTGVGATLKHFVAYGVPDGGVNWGAVSVGPRRLRDVMTAPFRAAINEAGAMSVMPSYNEVDGLALHGSPELLRDLLRDELGFDGVTAADYFGVACLESFHHLVSDLEEAGARALVAGVDIDLPDGAAYVALPAAVAAGKVQPADVDEACRRVLTQKEALGLFDDPFVDTGAVAAVVHRREHIALARRAAAASIVVLTNDGTLPLAPDARVAVLGPSAGDPRLLLGDYHYPAHMELMQASDDPGLAPGSGAPRRPLVQNPTPTLREALGARRTLVDDLAGADVAVVCVGGRSGLRHQDTSGEFRDVTDLGLAPEQVALVERVARAGIPTVTVVIGGRAHSLEDVAARSGALVLGWVPGEQGGEALADVLCGDVDASGRLPVSLLRRVGQVGLHSGSPRAGGRSMMWGDYVDAPVTPLFGFGHGLSYTTWAYSDLAVEAASADEDVTIAVTVTNTGGRTGTEVVQVYVRDEVASVGLPDSRLVGFARVDAEPGHAVSVTFRTPAGRLGFTGADLRYRVEPGAFTFSVGGLHATAELTGPVAFPDRNRLAPVTVHRTDGPGAAS
jgi:beta-glucosidase-like glycosyl hydrolase